MELRGALDAVTFFSTRGSAPAAPASSGVRGPIIVLIAAGALLAGLLAGMALG
jgi:hypothetical protein